MQTFTKTVFPCGKYSKPLYAQAVLRFSHWLICFLLLSPFLSLAQTSGNPILAGDWPDPEVRYFNGRYYIYPTADYSPAGQGKKFHAFSSADLTNWRDDGVIFDIGPGCNWAEYNGWAPSVAFRNNQYYLYYTAETKIGVAVSNSPTGPFTDIGSPLIGSDPYTVDIIDAMAFIDDDGQAYLYYGGSNGSRMVVRKLNPNMTSFNSEPMLITPPNYTEAPFLVKRDGIYYMTYSNAGWNTPNYNVQYATSSSPLGPWTYKGQILSSSDEEKGPGHHAILQIPGCDDYYVIYHRWENGDFNHGRATAIDRMYFNADASISRIVMTNEGVKPRTVNGACSPGNLFLGGTYKLTHRGTNQCLDVDYNSNAPLANVQQYNDNGNDAQRWVVTLEADGFYKLTHKGTNQCLDVSYNSASPGANVQQYTDNGGDAQRWKLEAMNDGYYKVTHKGTNQCLDAVGNSPNPGEVIQYTDNGNNAQRWKFDLISSAGIQNGGVYQLAPRFAPSKRLDVTGGSNVSGTNVGIWEKNNAPAQAWQFIDVGNGYYELIPQCATNSRLDVTAGNNANGTNVQIWYGFANTPAQQWRVILRPDGYYELEPRNAPGKRLDVAGERGESGANVDIWQSFGNLAQQWKLLPMNNNDARLAAPEILEASSVNLQAYPNPFSQQVTLSYTPLRTEPVSVVLYNSQGGLVQRVFEGEAEAGVAQKHILQGGSLKAGMYVVKLATSAGTFHRKIMVVR